ncbi:MAG TPA: GNAT family N-acetyltransferase [Gaiellaceae bacterium]|nr:GNAT family N-acetyltransferase [Gaiellaceae bacterium]
MGTSVQIARTAAEVETLRPVWEGFERDVASADIDYHLTLVERRARTLRPHVVLVARDGEPAALVVGRVEDVELPARLGYKTLGRPLVRALTVSYGGVLGRDDEETAAAVVRELRAALARGEADVARLRSLEVGSAVHRAARTSAGLLTLDRLGRPTPHWRARLDGSYDDYLARRSAKTRANVRRYGRKFEAAFPDAIEFRLFRDPADLDRLLEDTRAVHEHTYQHALGVGFSDSGVERHVTSFALERGWFRGFVLYVEGAPRAFWHGIRYGRVFSTGPTGYDPAFGSHRIGTYVLGRMVEELCREDGLEWVDFGFGDAEYKHHFGDESRLEEDVLVWARRPKALGLSLTRAALGLVDRSARSLLARRQLLTKARRLGRDRARGGGS